MKADLRGKLRREIEVKSSVDFPELFACKPYELAKISPSIVQSCKLVEGEFGKKGSVISWNFTNEGKPCTQKDMIENYDSEKGTMTYKVIEGEFAKSYKTCVAHLHVTKGDGNANLVMWTIEYEKRNEDVPDPTSAMDILECLTKQAAEYHLKSSTN